MATARTRSTRFRRVRLRGKCSHSRHSKSRSLSTNRTDRHEDLWPVPALSSFPHKPISQRPRETVISWLSTLPLTSLLLSPLPLLWVNPNSRASTINTAAPSTHALKPCEMLSITLAAVQADSTASLDDNSLSHSSVMLEGWRCLNSFTRHVLSTCVTEYVIQASSMLIALIA